ncbi:hypothetical protein CW736_12435 [Nonlabens sp. MB-3u-79]|uniref:hypothetical protein n=1 Tax=Nonlabens sp. MB-3u-79 TaxID=2058134 RepID=UPI000C316A6F|nr:hypothetical protein [Nonlabens sp. MB-3u-79]AUC80127.1 hypothetical protein CW736_12435 [Nonlabens sp. MB-3u-79]
MKNIYIGLLVLLTTASVNAQQFNEEAVKELADQVCECIQTKGDIETKEKAEMELGSCMLQAYSNNQKYFDDKGINFLDANNAEKLGEQVGIMLAGSCPESIPLFMLFADDIEEEMELEEENLVITGKIVKVEDDKFKSFEIKDEDGRRRKLLWLTYVDNDELLEDAVKGKTTYVFTAMELDIYDPRIGEYRNMLVLDRVDTK